MKKILVTGSNGLIGGEVVDYFAKKNVNVFGIDNNMRADFFGDSGDTSWNLKDSKRNIKIILIKILTLETDIK